MFTLFPRETTISLPKHISARETVVTHATVIVLYQSTYHHTKIHKKGYCPLYYKMCVQGIFHSAVFLQLFLHHYYFKIYGLHHM
jgi:hypothetical protein